MKLKNTITALVCVLLLVSCLESKTAKETSLKTQREQMIGDWHFSSESFQRIHPKDEVVMAFTLHDDATATVVFGNKNTSRVEKGSWSWQYKKELGNENFGLSSSTDVLVKVQKSKDKVFVIGFQLEMEDQELRLSTGRAHKYVKQ
ncbi:hypothetical protein HCG49_14765 [Arenibacter sp. 6A1]|uniref:hypothetical protein n=1 Tax=Arenibacter sp. 6A1 TaxID=2720391 RepID=UPI001444C8F1|nr:hypothetical protein [Arenibacter sp. 6A1]NKI27825.1 hypothetical protein [Arenibacter sp. 6A1]